MSELLLRLAPLRGLDTRNVQHPPNQGTPMVGGYNVEVRGAEWWVRHGHEMVTRQPTGSQPFMRIMQGALLDAILVSPWAVLRYDSTFGTFNEMYPNDAASNTDYTNGSAAATSAAAVGVVGDMLLVGGTGTTEVYRIAAVAGTAITLDRAYTGTTGTYATDFYRALVDVVNCSAYGAVGLDLVGPLTEAVLFEQLVSYTAASLGYANPATTAGTNYIIMTVYNDGDGEPVAIAGPAVAPLKDWFRLTGLAAPTEIASTGAVASAKFVETFKSCLFIAGGQDPTGNADQITIWFSRPNNFMLWHDGIQAGTYAHRFIVFEGTDEENPIVGMKALDGERLVVYRRWSFENVYATGPSFDYTSVPTNVRVFGNSIVKSNGQHFLMTDRGPAVCDGASIRPLAEDKLEAVLRDWRINRFETEVSGVLHDRIRQRIYWIFRVGNDALIQRASGAAIPASGTQAYTGNSYNTAQGVIALDYASGEVWLEDHICWTGGACLDFGVGKQAALIARCDGSLAKLYRHADGKDGAILYTGTDVAVDARVETPWLPLNGGQWAIANNAVVLLRALDAATASDNDVTDLWASGADTIHFGTVEFFTDWSMTAKCTRALTMLVSTMQALVSEGERALPIIPFDLSLEDVAGKVVKVRFRNTGGAVGTVKGHFRIVDVEFWGDALAKQFQPRTYQSATAA